jgi:hypothetical protein
MQTEFQHLIKSRRYSALRFEKKIQKGPSSQLLVRILPDRPLIGNGMVPKILIRFKVLPSGPIWQIRFFRQTKFLSLHP